MKITSQQARLVGKIDAYIKRHGRSPTFEELTALMGLKSKSNIARMLDALEEKGVVHRKVCTPRSIRLLSSQRSTQTQGRKSPPPPPPERLTATSA